MSICQLSFIECCRDLFYIITTQVHPIEYDVYLSYNNADQQLADKVTESLKETNNSIRIFTKHQTLNQNVSWQEEIYKVQRHFYDTIQCKEGYTLHNQKIQSKTM